jgi:hypothetical protein
MFGTFPAPCVIDVRAFAAPAVDRPVVLQSQRPLSYVRKRFFGFNRGVEFVARLLEGESTHGRFISIIGE